MAKLAAGEDPSDWPHGDLWRLLRAPAAGGRLTARKVPAHLTWDKAETEEAEAGIYRNLEYNVRAATERRLQGDSRRVSLA